MSLRSDNLPEYRSWNCMRARCLRPNNPKYPTYGAVGISVCARWLGKNGFRNFLADMGKRPSLDHSLDRYPNQKGNYEPGNCRWATVSQQQSNKSNAVIIEYRGERLNRAEWARRLGVDSDTIKARLDRGWSVERALTLPAQPTNLHPRVSP